MTIDELNERRALAQMRLSALGTMNTPLDTEAQLKASAQYRLAYDAWIAADTEYRDAMRALSTDELMALAQRS